MSAKAYRAAGVDLEAADSIKENIIAFASLTHGPDVLKNGNSFAGLYRLSGYKKPVLISSTDGVGTKLKIASLLGHYESIGVDTLGYLSIRGLLDVVDRPQQGFCDACFSGKYPIPVQLEMDKLLMERAE